MYWERICKRHLETWMNVGRNKPSTPLSNKNKIIQGFLDAKGDGNADAQADLAKEMGSGYRNGVCEAIFAMITTQPDAAHAVTRLSQLRRTVSPDELYVCNTRGRDILMEGLPEYGLASDTTSANKQQHA